ncbi:MAG: response regulator transcription factor [Methylophilaceae bacterium]|jgi:two-component system chemotaxis response regulator CheY|nr:response regulator [Methylophilaceae bacterium]
MGQKLLIVDDSSVSRSRIARAALHAGLEGLTICGMAANGAEALQISAREQPQLVTMDLTMPEMDGVTCIDAMIQQLPSVRILVISALSDKITAITALKKGATGFLYKPFTDEQLAHALAEISAQT